MASDCLGVSGRAMIDALIQGEEDPSKLARLARGRLKSKVAQLVAAMEGKVTGLHRFLLQESMRQLRFLEEQIARFEEEIERHLRPFEWAFTLLTSMPGVDRVAASALLGEIGCDMTRFPSARHLASWAGLCPGNNESAGHSRSGKSHRGNQWIRGMMTEIAWAASKTKNSYAAAFYRRLVIHKGKKRAIIALANSYIQAIWHMLTNREMYRDLGPHYFERLNSNAQANTLVKRLKKLGYEVTLQQNAA